MFFSKAFPHRKLKPSGGSISATITGKPGDSSTEALGWCVLVRFEPLRFKGDLLDAMTLTFDPLSIAVRDWKALDGATVRGGADVLHATAAILDRAPIAGGTVAFSGRSGTTMQVAFDVAVDVSSWGDRASVNPLPLAGSLRLPFTGFTFQETLVRPRPENHAIALEIAARHVDLACYDAPTTASKVFLFRPV